MGQYVKWPDFWLNVVFIAACFICICCWAYVKWKDAEVGNKKGGTSLFVLPEFVHSKLFNYVFFFVSLSALLILFGGTLVLIHRYVSADFYPFSLFMYLAVSACVTFGVLGLMCDCDSSGNRAVNTASVAVACVSFIWLLIVDFDSAWLCVPFLVFGLIGQWFEETFMSN